MITLFIKLKESIYIALRALRLNKLRAILTTLGIIIGVLTVTSVSAIIAGLNEGFASQISSLGSNTLYIQKYPWMGGEDWFKYRNRPDVTMEEAQYIRERLQADALVSPSSGTSREIKYRDNSLTDIRINGVTGETEKIDNLVISKGRYFTPLEIRRRKNQAVIGYEIQDKLFRHRNPLGKRIWIGGVAYTVIGVIEKRGSLLGFNLDSFVYIPIGSLFKNFGFHRSVSIDIKVADAAQIEAVKQELTFLMRLKRGLRPKEEDDFSINQQEVLTNTYNQLTRGLYTAAIGIGALSLLVGGIGIMNIMLVSVAERKREIGIRKALGATKGMVSLQFIVESVLICAVGGLIAILLSYAVSLAIDKATPFPATVPIWSIFLGLGFSALVGIFFGLYPAHQAAKLDPIECLHYE